ncbi:MAG: hypothetical protein IT383_03425 [Deltaproteobacteria bacterium]|nr:hypothetical protein [Deltaproteobacteria bacterium]
MRVVSLAIASHSLLLSGCAVLGLRVPCDSDASCPGEQPVCVEGVCAVALAEGEGEGEGDGDCGVEVPADLELPLLAVVNPDLAAPLHAGCFTTISDAVAASLGAGPGAIVVGEGVFREAWPLMVPTGLTIVGAGPLRTRLEVSTESSVLIVDAEVSLVALQIVRTAAQTALPLVDLRGIAMLVDLELRGSQTLLGTSGAALYLQDVVFEGGVVGSLIADAETTVILQSCTIEAGQLILDGSGTHEIRDTVFAFTGDDELRIIGNPDVTLDRIHVVGAAGMDHLVDLRAGRVSVRGSTFEAPSVTNGLMLARDGLTSLDLGGSNEADRNTFSAPAGRADLVVDMAIGAASAAGNTWSHDPPRCGFEVRFGSATSISVALEGATCGPTRPMCGVQVPNYREVPFRAVVGSDDPANGCYPLLGDALTALAGQGNVGVFVATNLVDTPATDLNIAGLVLEGQDGASVTAGEGSLFAVSQPATLRNLELLGAAAYGNPLLSVAANVVVDDCTFSTWGVALAIPAGGATSFDVSGCTFNTAADAAEILNAQLQAGDVLRFLDNVASGGAFHLEGAGAAQILRNHLVAREDWRMTLATTGSVDVFDNVIIVVDGSVCREGLLLQRGGITLRRNSIDVDEPTTTCTAIAIQDLGPLTVDLGTVTNPGGNTLVGHPDLYVELREPGSQTLIPAIGTVWSTTSPTCGDDDTATIAIASTSNPVSVQYQEDETCP